MSLNLNRIVFLSLLLVPGNSNDRLPNLFPLCCQNFYSPEFFFFVERHLLTGSIYNNFAFLWAEIIKKQKQEQNKTIPWCVIFYNRLNLWSECHRGTARLLRGSFRASQPAFLVRIWLLVKQFEAQLSLLLWTSRSKICLVTAQPEQIKIDWELCPNHLNL